jgi:hypothetical protein
MEIGCGDGSLGYQVFPSCDESMDWDLYGDVFFMLHYCCIGNLSFYLATSLTL